MTSHIFVYWWSPFTKCKQRLCFVHCVISTTYKWLAHNSLSVFVKCITSLQRDSSFHIIAKRDSVVYHVLGKNTTSLSITSLLKIWNRLHLQHSPPRQRNIILSKSCAYSTSTFPILILCRFLNEIIREVQKRSKAFPHVFEQPLYHIIGESFPFIVWAQGDIWSMAGENLDLHLTLKNSVSETLVITN